MASEDPRVDQRLRYIREPTWPSWTLKPHYHEQEGRGHSGKCREGLFQAANVLALGVNRNAVGAVVAKFGQTVEGSLD